MRKPQGYEDVAAKIRRLARDPETKWLFGSCVRQDGSTHATDEMAKDGIELTDVQYVLKRCWVSRADQDLRWGAVRYVAEGKNLDGVPMAFPVTFSDNPKQIEVVTGWVRK